MKPIYQDQNDNSFVIGSSSQIRKILDTVKRISPYDATVILTGESGVGKGRFAELIHSFGMGENAPLVTINCGAIPENLLESELFGYEQGAFTGANQKGKIGLIETSNNGTLFLDEIADLSMQMQAKLLRVIQEKKIVRVGGTREIDVDFRLITATSKDIPALIKKGSFRQDLFYRLNTISVNIPPLRERKEDILDLVEFFSNKYNSKYEKNHCFSRETIVRLEKYPWPGNIRELENIVEGIILTAEADVITEDMLPDHVYCETAMEKYNVGKKTLKEILGNVEKEVLFEAYRKYGTTTKVAEVLGISQASVSIKLNKYGYRV